MRNKRKGAAVFYPLNSEIRLYTAMIDRHVVAAFQGREVVGYATLVGTGRIAKITDEAVVLVAEDTEEVAYYLRESCEFYRV